MSQVSIIDIEGNHPQIPIRFNANVGFAIAIANVLEILGDVVAAGSTPVQTVGSGNTITTNVQLSQAIGATDATKVGLSAYNSSQFSVDANGFVSLNAIPSIFTIQGDSGSVSGNTIQLYGSSSLFPGTNAGASVIFEAKSATELALSLTTSGTVSTFLGLSSGNKTQGGSGNTGVGASTLHALTSGAQNTAVGNGALGAVTSGVSNTAVGFTAGDSITTGIQNTVLGNDALTRLTSGSSNIVIGDSAGFNYTTESSNIILGHLGIASDNGVIRIGSSLNKCFISGIYGRTLASAQYVTITSTGEMGSTLASIFNYVSTAISYAVLSTDSIVGVTNNSAARTITMPNSGLVSGQIFTIKDAAGTAASANNITISGNGSTIDGSATYLINTNYGSVSMVFDGTNFLII